MTGRGPAAEDAIVGIARRGIDGSVGRSELGISVSVSVASSVGIAVTGGVGRWTRDIAIGEMAARGGSAGSEGTTGTGPDSRSRRSVCARRDDDVLGKLSGVVSGKTIG